MELPLLNNGGCMRRGKESQWEARRGEGSPGEVRSGEEERLEDMDTHSSVFCPVVPCIASGLCQPKGHQWLNKSAPPFLL